MTGARKEQSSPHTFQFWKQTLIIANFRTEKETLGLTEGHRRFMALLDILDPSLPRDGWYRVPHSAEENDKRWIACRNEDLFLSQTAIDMGAEPEPFADVVNGYAVLVTTATDQEAWENGTHTEIDFSPWRGMIRIETTAPQGTSQEIYEKARDRFLRVCRHLDVSYASCDFPRAPRPNGSPGKLYYGGDLQVFPHREFFGWMGFVKNEVDSYEIPEADEVIPLPEKGGTMIVTVADAFDVHNAAHVEKAQRVEMRLAGIDALPVADPRFLSAE